MGQLGRIRDANDQTSPAEVPQQESSMPAEAAAMATRTGNRAGCRLQRNAENPADVASIVDVALADLRPRLMAEIYQEDVEKK